MAIVIFTIYFITTAVASLYKFKYGVFLFFLSYFAYPEILALGIGSDGFALSMPRALLLLFSIIVLMRILLIIEDRRHLWKLFRQRKDFILFGILLYLWKVLCTFINTGISATSLSGLVNDFLIFFTLVFSILLTIKKRSDLIILLYLLLGALVINELLGLYEILFEQSLFKNVTYNFSFSRDLSKLTFRGNKIRIQTIYANSIALGFMLALSSPMLYFYIRRLKKIRFIPYTIFFFLPVMVFFTRSRGSLILLALIAVLIISNFIISRFSTSYKEQRLLSIYLCIVIFVVPILFADQIFTLINNVIGGSNISLTEDSSANTRLSQFLVFADLPIKAMFFGFGRVRQLLDIMDNMLALDSFYIRTTLESGIPGLFLLIGFQISSLIYSIRLLKKVWLFSFYRLLVGNICLTLFVLILVFNLTSSSYFSFFLFGYPALLLTIDHIFSNQYVSTTR